MHNNQPFCSNPGNVFNNGYGYGYNIYNPPPINGGFYPPSVVGEGEVNCITLPDGTCQFYFTPTANWCGPNNYPCHTMINTNNINPYWSPTTGSWFVRSITSPIPAVWNNPPLLRHEAPIPFRSLDCSMTAINNGYQLKFHNDMWTSTSDIHYFYPCLRPIDSTLPLPTRGCAAVQVDTPMMTNTICHYDVVCSKPCHCISTPTPDTKPTEVIHCHCGSSSKSKRPLTTKSAQRLQLLPTDVGKKRIKLERNTKRDVKSKSIDVICKCSSPLTLQKKTQSVIGNKSNDVSCECSPSPSSDKITKDINGSKCNDVSCECTPSASHNVIKSKSKDVICECSPPLSVEKSAATHDAYKAIGGDHDKRVQSPCCWRKEKPVIRGDAFVRIQPETWCPLTDSIRKVFQLDKRESETACCSSYCS